MAYDKRTYNKEWASSPYGRNIVKGLVRGYAARNRIFVLEYYAVHPCVDCGEDDARVLDFDHVRGEKKDLISRMVNRGHSIKRIKAEIAKCDVRCSNCHRKRHHRELERMRADE